MHLYSLQECTDVEDALVDTAEEGEGGTNQERSIDICTVPNGEQIANGKLLYNTGSSAQPALMT